MLKNLLGKLKIDAKTTEKNITPNLWEQIHITEVLE